MTQYEKLTEVASPLGPERFLELLEEYIAAGAPDSSLLTQAHFARVNFARLAQVAPPPGVVTRAAVTPADYVHGICQIRNWARRAVMIVDTDADLSTTKRLLANLRILHDAFYPEKNK